MRGAGVTAATVLAVDLGGTNMRAAVVTASGEMLHREKAATPDTDDRPDRVVEFVRQFVAKDVASVVMGVPGRVDYRAGVLQFAPNLPPSWHPDLTCERLATALGVPVSLANDADLAAVGEAWFGAGRDARDVVYMTVSTGVGAGVVLDGAVVRGSRSLAEVGHTVLDLGAAARGEPATVERMGSGTALERLAAEAGLDATGKEIAALVRSGDPVATRVWGRMTDAVAAAAGNLAHLFSPEVIVVGGGVGLSGDLLLDPIREWLRGPFGPRQLPRPIEVRVAALGDDAALVGAAAWGRSFAAETVTRG